METPSLLSAAAALTAPGEMSIEQSGNPFVPSFIESIPLSSLHPTAGLELQLDPLCGRFCILGWLPSFPAAGMRCWRSRFCFAYILSVNAVQILTLTDFEQSIATLCSTKFTSCDLFLMFDDIRNNLSTSGLLQLSFDQCRDIWHINASTIPGLSSDSFCTPTYYKKSSNTTRLDRMACIWIWAVLPVKQTMYVWTTMYATTRCCNF